MDIMMLLPVWVGILLLGIFTGFIIGMLSCWVGPHPRVYDTYRPVSISVPNVYAVRPSQNVEWGEGDTPSGVRVDKDFYPILDSQNAD